jgi:hypothetical protein
MMAIRKNLRMQLLTGYLTIFKKISGGERDSFPRYSPYNPYHYNTLK